MSDYGPVAADGTIATNGNYFWSGPPGDTFSALGTTADGESITSPPVVSPVLC